MARRRAKNTRRDKYGRYRGKGGIKPWKNNNPDYYRKGRKGWSGGKGPKANKSSLKKKAAIGIAAAGIAAGTAYGVHKYRQSKAQPIPGRRPVGRVVPRRGVAQGGSRLRRVRNSVPGGTNATAATRVAGRSAPTTNTPTPRAAAAGVVNPAPVAIAQPQAINTPKTIDAKSIAVKAATSRAVTGAVASGVLAAVTRPGKGDEAYDDTDERRDYWRRVEDARERGIPAAANFVSMGGDPSTYNGPRQANSIWRPTVEERPVVEALEQHKKKVKKQKQPKAPAAIQAPPKAKPTPVIPKPSSFTLHKTSIATATPTELKLTNEAGNRIRVFPQSRLSARPKKQQAKAIESVHVPKVEAPAKSDKAASGVAKPMPQSTAAVKVAEPVAKKRGRPAKDTAAAVPLDAVAMRKRAAEIAAERMAKQAEAMQATTAVRPLMGQQRVKNTGTKVQNNPFSQPKEQKKYMSEADYMTKAVKAQKSGTEADFVEWLVNQQESGIELPRHGRALLKKHGF